MYLKLEVRLKISIRNYSARTVLGPDSTVGADTIVVPDCIATRVPTPHVVRDYSLAFLQSLVDKKEATIVVRDGRRINLDYKQRKAGTLIEYGDVIIRQTQKLNKKTGQLEMVTQEIVPESQNDLQPGDLLKKASGVLTKTSTSSYRRFILQEGDIVYRHLQSGDVVTINRQPT